MIYDEDEDGFFCEYCHANPCICYEDAEDEGGWAIGPKQGDSPWDMKDNVRPSGGDAPA